MRVKPSNPIITAFLSQKTIALPSCEEGGVKLFEPKLWLWSCWWRTFFNQNVVPQMGLKVNGSKLPVTIYEYRTMVDTNGIDIVWGLRRSEYGRSLHRVYMICPNCDREIPAGRVHQHRG